MTDTAKHTGKADFLHPGMKILVVGLGRTGAAAVKFFLRQGAVVSVSDASPAETLPPDILALLAGNNIAHEAGGHTEEFFSSADLIFVSPGIPLTIEPLKAARQRSIPILGELAIVSHYLKTPAVGITGTNGKTTVTTLLGDIFRASSRNAFVGGNIGTPLFEYISGSQADDLVVAEISSFQLDTGGGPDGLPFKAAILLNITPDHLERYDSFSAYAESKFTIFAAQTPEDFAILNGDDPEIMDRQYLWPGSRKFFFGENLSGRAGAAIHGARVIMQNSDDSFLPGSMNGEVYDLAGTSLEDPPNRQNGAAAILTARLMGCPRGDILGALASFKPLAHRMTLVTEIAGVRYIDDSKATNVGAVYSALASIRQPVILIAGGRDKGGDYSILAELIQEKVKHLLLIGEAREMMMRAFLAFTNVEILDTLPEAVARAAGLAQPGDTVLLSPACASFDMFKSYAERGDVFRNAVLALKKSSSNFAGEGLIH